MRLSPDAVEEVRVAARLHDVGNVAVRDDVLLKPGALSADELDHLRDHVRVGVVTLRQLGFMDRIVSYVGDHTSTGTAPVIQTVGREGTSPSEAGSLPPPRYSMR